MTEQSRDRDSISASVSHERIDIAIAGKFAILIFAILLALYFVGRLYA
jgi:hypothetical protein